MNKNGLNKREGGFTLIEIAIVVVIIGLLLGGVLKGQEMIRSARSHNIITQSNGLKAAMLGFTDRYRAMPGDYSAASSNIPGVTPATVFNADGSLNGVQGQDGNGDSYIGGPGTVVAAGDPRTFPQRETFHLAELGLVWLHLGNAGYISGGYVASSTGLSAVSWACPLDTCMRNAYNGNMFILYDNQQAGKSAMTDNAPSHQLLSGKDIPVAVIAEIDSKTDDGHPGNGNFRLADKFVPDCATDTAGAASTAATYVEGTKGVARWAVLGGLTCGGVYMF